MIKAEDSAMQIMHNLDLAYFYKFNPAPPNKSDTVYHKKNLVHALLSK